MCDYCRDKDRKPLLVYPNNPHEDEVYIYIDDALLLSANDYDGIKVQYCPICGDKLFTKQQREKLQKFRKEIREDNNKNYPK